jgi:iron complex outermembrane receptor protein
MNEGKKMKIIKILTRGVFIAGLTIVLGLVAAPVTAQQQAGDSPPLDEITVTARKREESLQEVSLSVLAFDADTLARDRIYDMRDLATRVPGLTLNVGNVTDSEVFMRGIGSDIQSAAADRAVGIFIDGVYMSRGTGTLIDLYGLERVEVVRGPQSLLYGKNVVGGLINYVTRKPSEEFESQLEGTWGDYSQIDVAGSVSGAVSDNVSGSLSFSSRRHDGYAQITSSGGNGVDGEAEDLDSSTLRGQLLFTPGDDLEVLVSADVTSRDAGMRWVDIVEAGDSTAVTFIPFILPDSPPALPVDSLPGLDGFTLPARNAPFKNSDPRSGPQNFEGFQDASLWGTSVKLDWELDSGVQFMSQIAYREADISVRDAGHGMFWDFPLLKGSQIPDIAELEGATILEYLAVVPDDYFDQRKTDDVKQLSLEFALSGGDGPLTWRAGLYYLTEDITRSETVNYSFPDFDILIGAAFDLAFFGPGTVALPPDPAPGFRGTSLADTASEADNIGAFGEIDFEFGNNMSLNAGLRYVRDDKDFFVARGGLPFDGNFTTGPFSASDSESWDEILPSVTLSWGGSENANMYARYARGYKAGGWNGENAADALEATEAIFDPELADSFELGGKFLLADNRVQLNVAAYFASYDDLQTQQFVSDNPSIPPNNLIVNAANGTEAYGVEVDFMAAVTDGFTLWGNYAYTQCEFTGELIIDAQGTDIDGNTCRRTPENAINVGIDATRELGNGGSGFFRLDYNWADEFFFDNENKALTTNDSESTLNASIGFVSSDGRWEMSVWGKNITDELNNASLFELFDTLYANYTPPRTYGVTFRWNN